MITHQHTTVNGIRCNVCAQLLPEPEETTEECLHDDGTECGHCNQCGEYVGTGMPEWESNYER